MATTANNRRCKAKNRRGEPCGAFAVGDSDYCYWHDPKMARGRAEARRRGGRARHGRQVGSVGSLADRLEQRQFRTLADMTALLEIAVQQTLQLENSVSRNRCLGYLARCWANLYETSELEERLSALERTLQERTG